MLKHQAISKPKPIIQRLLLPFAGVYLVSIVLIGVLWVRSEFATLELQNRQFEQDYVHNLKQELKTDVERVRQLLLQEKRLAETSLETHLKQQIDEAYTIVSNLYESHRHLGDDVVRDLVVSALKDIRTNNGRSSYFIGGLDKRPVLYPPKRAIEGKLINKGFTLSQQDVVKQMIKLSLEQGEGFIRYHWPNPQMGGEIGKKYSYIKLFEPYGWVIGIGDFLENYEAEVRQSTFEKIANMTFGINGEGYIFINSYEGDLYVTNGVAYDGTRNIWNLTDLVGEKLVQENARIAKENPEGGFNYYYWRNSEEGEPSEKLSFVRGMDEWNIFIGSGAYLDTVKNVVNQRQLQLKKHVKNQVLFSVLILIIAAIVILFALMYFARKLRIALTTIKRTFTKSVDERTYIDTNNLFFSEFVHIARSANFMIDGLNKQAEELRHHAVHDHLTALPNRKFGQVQLSQMIEFSLKNNTKGALLFLDLDNFKEVNDTLGHSTGDELLKQVSQRLRSVTREGDTIARLGGDEFTVITDYLHDAKDAAMIAQKLCDVFAEPFTLSNTKLHMTASVGITIFPDDGEDAETLLKNADSAMYASKQEGRNRYCFYSPSMTEEVEQRFKLVDELREAIKANQFVLSYQPQYDIENEKIYGVEALIRWQHPTRGLILPDEFIPYAEYSGQITQIGKWVLSEACRQIVDWQKSGIHVPKVAINISSRQLHNDMLIDLVRDALIETGCQGEWLELEMTESVLIENPKELTKQLLELQDLGVGISVDDFGTGYSSLSYIKQLPIDTLKIDRTFIRDIHEDENDRAITRAIISLGNSLNLKVVAEGVENQYQIDFLKDEQCVLAQGYYFSKPLSSKEFAEYWRSIQQKSATMELN